MLFRSLPQFTSEKALADWLDNHGIKTSKPKQLIAFRHTFSHFHLEIVPIYCEIKNNTKCLDESNGYWYKLNSENAKIGLATPVYNLLNQSH